MTSQLTQAPPRSTWYDRTWQPVTPAAGLHSGHTLHDDRIEEPLRWKKTGRVLVSADLFHHTVPDLFLTRVFDAMEISDRQTFLLVTQHAARMRDFVQQREALRQEYATRFDHCPTEAMRNSPAAQQARARAGKPPANIWLGVRAGNQFTAEARIPTLLDTPAAVRLLVCEPLTGPIELYDYLTEDRDVTDQYLDAPEGAVVDGMEHRGDHWQRVQRIHWVIAGGDRGANAQPLHLQWVRGIRDTCAASRVPFYFTGHGEYLTAEVTDEPGFAGGRAYNHPIYGSRTAAVVRERGRSGTFRGGTTRAMEPGDRTRATWMLDTDTIAVRVGAKTAGRELDGRTHDAVPGNPPQ
jgi:protein gp37